MSCLQQVEKTRKVLAMQFPWFRRKTAGESVPETPKAKAIGMTLELLQVLAVSLAIIIPVRWFLIQPFYVQGASMEPNFFDHEYLIIDELSYRVGNPERGDVVVFHYPNDTKQFFIKRVIGLPGETVEIADGKVKIYNDQHPNGVQLDESAYLDQSFTAASQTVTLKPNQFFVLGDNRSSSLDSRFFGPVDRSYIVGRVWVRGYPIDRWKTFDHQTYPGF
jgi:signal peptidase I